MAACTRATTAIPRSSPPCARRSGPTSTLMVDVQYLWEDAATCLSVVKDWAEFDIFSWRRRSGPTISTRWRKLAERGAHADRLRRMAGDPVRVRGVDGSRQGRRWPSPTSAASAGIGEAKIVCDMAAERGRIIVPHCWKTGISISATAHLAFITSRIAPSSNICRLSSASRRCARSWPCGSAARERRDPVADEARPRLRARLGRPSRDSRWPRCGASFLA